MVDEATRMIFLAKTNETSGRSVQKQANTLSKLLFALGPLVTLLFIADKLLQGFTKARIFFIQAHDTAVFADLDADLPSGFSAEVRCVNTIGNLHPACATALNDDFIAGAKKNADACVAILEGDTVVSFQWLSQGLTWAYDDMFIGFGSQYLYGYNSFTAPSHRGRHLNRSGVVVAARKLAIPKGKGLAGFIMAGNAASLLAHARVSGINSGFALAWPYGSYGLQVFASPGCHRAGLHLVRRARGISRQVAASAR